MSLTSGGWTLHTDRPADPPAQHEASPQSSISGYTVLMSVRVSVCHSGIRPLCLPGAGDESLRLQLSMDPGKSGEFRLTLRGGSGTGRSVTIADFDLRTVNYEVKSPKCHELRLAAPPHDRISFNFRCEQEAQQWATVVLSSLREANRVSAADKGLPENPRSSSQDTLALQLTEDACIELTQAIAAGDAESASAFAASLARQRAALKIQHCVKDPEQAEINLTVVVEDFSSSCCVSVKVFPQMTTASLKQQMFIEYGFHPRVQRWVIGQCLCIDQRSLASYGIRQHGDTAFLYLTSARHARLTQQVFQQDQERAVLLNLPAVFAETPSQPATSTNGPSTSHERPSSTLPSRLPTSSSSVKELINLDMPQLSKALSPSTASVQGWPCPSCTYINKPTRPGCEICSTNRPESYAVPGGYRPDALELKRIQLEKEAIRQYQQEKGRREVLRRAALQNNSLVYNLDQDY